MRDIDELIEVFMGTFLLCLIFIGFYWAVDFKSIPLTITFIFVIAICEYAILEKHGLIPKRKKNIIMEEY